MSDLDFVQTWHITFTANPDLQKVSTIRSITLAATSTDIEDAVVLAYSDLAEEFGVEIAKCFTVSDKREDESDEG